MSQTAFSEPGPSFKDAQAAFMQLISVESVAKRLGSREIGQDGSEKPASETKAPAAPASPAGPGA